MGITNSPNITGSAVTFSGLSQITDTTDSTSSTTGSLVVTGGVGIAKNVYIGAGLSVAGTLTYEDVTSVDSVGLITAKSGVNVTGGQLQVGVAYSVGATGITTGLGFVCGSNGFNGEGGTSNFAALNITNSGEFKVGTAVTISSTAGVTTFSGDVIFDGATEDRTITFDKSDNALKVADNTNINIGTGNDLKIYHNGSHSFIDEAGTGNLYIRSGTDNGITLNTDADVILYHDNAIKFQTTNDGAVTTGIGTFTAGANFDGILSEKFNTVAGKLSDNTTIDLEDGMIHYFSTTETTTSTPNIRYSSSKSLNNMLTIGDSVSVTVITTAAAAGYSVNWQIDGTNVTEEWNGGSAPSEGGAGGYDVYVITLLKTASNTYVVLANLSNFA